MSQRGPASTRPASRLVSIPSGELGLSPARGCDDLGPESLSTVFKAEHYSSFSKFGQRSQSIGKTLGVQNILNPSESHLMPPKKSVLPPRGAEEEGLGQGQPQGIMAPGRYAQSNPTPPPPYLYQGHPSEPSQSSSKQMGPSMPGYSAHTASGDSGNSPISNPPYALGGPSRYLMSRSPRTAAIGRGHQRSRDPPPPYTLPPPTNLPPISQSDLPLTQGSTAYLAQGTTTSHTTSESIISHSSGQSHSHTQPLAGSHIISHSQQNASPSQSQTSQPPTRPLLAATSSPYSPRDPHVHPPEQDPRWPVMTGLPGQRAAVSVVPAPTPGMSMVGVRGVPMSAGIGAEGHQLFIRSPHGDVPVPIDFHQASKQADEKRLRNAGASARFRARKKEREREQSLGMQRLEAANRELQHRIRELEEERNFYRDERNRLRDIVSQTMSIHEHAKGPPSPMPAPRSSEATSQQQASQVTSSAAEPDPRLGGSGRPVVSTPVTATANTSGLSHSVTSSGPGRPVSRPGSGPSPGQGHGMNTPQHGTPQLSHIQAAPVPSPRSATQLHHPPPFSSNDVERPVRRRRTDSYTEHASPSYTPSPQLPSISYGLPPAGIPPVPPPLTTPGQQGQPPPPRLPPLRGIDVPPSTEAPPPAYTGFATGRQYEDWRRDSTSQGPPR